MNAFCYCPSCGFYEKFDFDTSDVCFDAERHCGDCGSEMVTKCKNPLCTSHIIESLSKKFCPCGTAYPNIDKAHKKYQGDTTLSRRSPLDDVEGYSLSDGPY